VSRIAFDYRALDGGVNEPPGGGRYFASYV
jgi:hypothetical protein